MTYDYSYIILMHLGQLEQNGASSCPRDAGGEYDGLCGLQQLVCCNGHVHMSSNDADVRSSDSSRKFNGCCALFFTTQLGHDIDVSPTAKQFNSKLWGYRRQRYTTGLLDVPWKL